MKQNETTKTGKTLVTGGTGKTGRRVARLLAAKGFETRIASRTSDPAFDWNAQDTWDGVLEGVQQVYVAYAPDLAIPGAVETIQAFTQRAVAAGVQRLVLLSGRGEAEARACERIVQTSGVAWTIVRASWFMQNFSEGEFVGMVLDGVIRLPAADIPEPFIDVNDIAEVAAAALTEPGHTGEIYEVTGPQALTFAALARQISVATGHEVPFHPISTQTFVRELADAGAPAGATWLMNYLFETVLDGRNAQACDGVERALGRKPRSFREFALRVSANGVWKSIDARSAA